MLIVANSLRRRYRANLGDRVWWATGSMCCGSSARPIWSGWDCACSVPRAVAHEIGA